MYCKFCFVMAETSFSPFLYLSLSFSTSTHPSSFSLPTILQSATYGVVANNGRRPQILSKLLLSCKKELSSQKLRFESSTDYCFLEVLNLINPKLLYPVGAKASKPPLGNTGQINRKFLYWKGLWLPT